MSSSDVARTRGAVLHPDLTRGGGPRRDPHARLAEAVGLAEAIAMTVAWQAVVPVPRPRPATLLGQGAVDQVAEAITAEGIEVVVVDGTLTPTQQRNLERAWDCKVIDRTGLILEIFGERARTREGTLQVELAALTYQRGRLVRSWTHLERQRGGLGFVGGPGETQIETDRRLISERITSLKRQLAEVTRTRGLHRQARQRVPYPVVALVGYTNAGKSTLFNTVTTAEVMAQDMLFATLDPTMRALELPSRRPAILSDTVGFVSDLPHELVAAFRATLEEVTAADVIVHVRDIAHPETETQKADVAAVLAEMGLDEAALGDRMIEVLNKVDRLDPDKRAEVAQRAARQPRTVALSALTGEGAHRLLAVIEDTLVARHVTVTVDVPVSDGELLAWLYRQGRVEARRDGDDVVTLTVGLAPENLARLHQRWPEVTATPSAP